MKRALVIFVLIGFSWPVSAQPNYKPARVISAGDAYVPFQVMIDGFFVFDVVLNDDGTVERIDALRDPGAMPGAAKTSISSWKFQLASKDPASGASQPHGKSAASVVRPGRRLCVGPGPNFQLTVRPFLRTWSHSSCGGN